jgi:hypothetical protein
MGKTTTPKYRLVLTDQAGSHVMIWRGRATDKRLERWVNDYTASLHNGGVNAHISKALGYIPVPSKARIERNTTGGQTVASWNAPMFWVFP